MKIKHVLLLILVVFLLSSLFYKQLYKVDSVTQVSEKQTDTSATSELANTNEQPTVKTESNKVLNLSKQGLDKLPAYVLKLSNLEELNISNNKISGALPAEIHDLRSLKVLNASNNLMTGVPAEVGQLQNLEVLDLSNNALTGLPYELGNLKKLRILNLSGNNYAKQDLETIKKSLPSDVEIIL